ncbi:MAG: M42 family peptidase [Kiritimatiellae bacterium]|nr:M42 family peptidase [Kiritimatiellia bacterium]
MNTCALDFLKSLMALPTPSGWETDGMRLAASYLSSHADEISFDLHGNLHAVVNAGAPTRIMIEGHCDEIGLMVQYIDDDGFLSMTAIGGLTVQLLAGERIVIQGRKGPVSGVFGVRPPHLMKPADKDKVVSSELVDLWVDIGASSRAQALEAVELGSPAVVDAGWRQLAGDRVACRGFDNRIGAFVVAEALKQVGKLKPKVAVHMVLTVQEELGLVGATTAVHEIQPHAGICVDVGFASDYPGNDRKLVGDVRLGRGPILCFGPTYNPKLHALMETVAAKESITLQRQVRGRGNNTNAWAMRTVRGGAAASLVSVPLRYMHSAVETLSLSDVDGAVRLVAATVQALPAKPDFFPDPLPRKAGRVNQHAHSSERSR